jgi:hypothetical protein
MIPRKYSPLMLTTCARNLYDRVIKHINFHSELSIGPEGQEGIVVIQYNPGDEYM